MDDLFARLKLSMEKATSNYSTEKSHTSVMGLFYVLVADPSIKLNDAVHEIQGIFSLRHDKFFGSFEGFQYPSSMKDPRYVVGSVLGGGMGVGVDVGIEFEFEDEDEVVFGLMGVVSVWVGKVVGSVFEGGGGGLECCCGMPLEMKYPDNDEFRNSVPLTMNEECPSLKCQVEGLVMLCRMIDGWLRLDGGGEMEE
ncbi:hypothetical protein Tco_0379703 [Tanacetum coccineum]